MSRSSLAQQFPKRARHGKPVQEATVRKYLAAVSAVLSDAKHNEIIQKAPACMIDLPDTEPQEQSIPDPDEVARFLRALTEEPFHYVVYYLLAICTGCRRGGLCALKWSGFPFESVAEPSRWPSAASAAA